MIVHMLGASNPSPNAIVAITTQMHPDGWVKDVKMESFVDSAVQPVNIAHTFSLFPSLSTTFK